MTASNLSELDSKTRAEITIRILAALERSKAFRQPRTWWQCVVILRQGEKARATTRIDFSSWLRNAGLEAQAREALHRRVAPREILVWIERDVGTGFVAWPLDTTAIAEARQQLAERVAS